MKYSILLISLCMTACDQTRDVGDLPAEGGDTAVALQHLSASVARSYRCPGGALPGVDGVERCACDTTVLCDGDAAAPCACDGGCVDARPEIDCADYALTFTVANATSQPIARMTSLRFSVPGLEEHKGGLTCEGLDWALAPGATSPVLDVSYRYDSGAGQRYAQPKFEYSCAPKPSDGPRTIEGDSGSIDPSFVGFALPPAPSTGTVLLEVTGVLQDGTSWTATASAEL